MQIRAVIAPRFGGPEVLSVVESELSDPRPGEVVVDVRAAGTNPIDYKLFAGTYGADPSSLPISPGFEVAGVVRATGGNVDGPSGRIQVGDEVIVYRANAGYASAVLAAAETVVPKPRVMSFEEASGLMLTGVTAIHALTVVRVTRGETVLINGAAGGVGLMAVQLALGDGARVIGTAGPAQHKLLRDLGAEPVTYGEGLVERVRSLAPDGVDAALDLVGSDDAGEASFALVKDRDRVVTIVASGRAKALGATAIGGGAGSDPGTEIRSAGRFELLRRVEAGTLKVFVERAYSLADASAALEELQKAHAHGKIVLIP
ncbi:MAG TPA: NADP-dependent oxidoreductase [Acidimicrobiales bacterium]|nr:NADP-dependent oxidoreductase [Acidimicrobiales bacterium]